MQTALTRFAHRTNRLPVMGCHGLFIPQFVQGLYFTTWPYLYVLRIGPQNYNSLTFWFPGRCSKVLNLLRTLGISEGGNTS